MVGGEKNLSAPDREQSQGQDSRSRKTRRIPLGGVGIDLEGVVKFAGEAGGPPGSIELSGEQLKAYERKEAELKQNIYQAFLDLGRSEAEARELAGLD